MPYGQTGGRRRRYGAQVILRSFRDDLDVGDPYGGVADAPWEAITFAPQTASSVAAAGVASSADLIGALAGSTASLLTGLLGLAGKTKQAKQQRSHEAELSALNLEAATLAAKSNEILAAANADAQKAATTRAATYAAYGVGGLVALGLIGGITFIIVQRMEVQ